MPLDYSDYPANWPAIRLTILERDGHRCKFCGVANHVYGWRDAKGGFHPWPDEKPAGGWIAADRLFTIVLTVAHLDHDLTNNDFANLAALCQRCHLLHDLPQHVRNAAATRRRKRIDDGQTELF